MSKRTSKTARKIALPVGVYPQPGEQRASSLATPTITIRGERAIQAAEQGAALYVFNDQRGWIPAGPGAVARARRMMPHALWIYGVA